MPIDGVDKHQVILVSYYIAFLNQLLRKSIIGWLFIAYVVDVRSSIYSRR